MKLEKGKFYKIVVNFNNTTLTYNCEILEVDGRFFSFKDIYNKTYTYNLNSIVSFQEREGEKEEKYGE